MDHAGSLVVNLSQKSVKDALDLEGFYSVFNYKMRYLREHFLTVFDVEQISVPEVVQ